MRTMKWLAPAVLIGATIAQGAEIQRGIASVAAIHDGEGASRLLCKLEQPIALEGVAVRRAILRVPFSGAVEPRSLELRAYAISRDWTPGAVGWRQGWTEPGGDLHRDLYGQANVDLAVGSSEIRFDVTSAFKESLEHGTAFYGFALSVPPRLGQGIRTEDLPRFGQLGNAEVMVSYKLAPVPPRAR